MKTARFLICIVALLLFCAAELTYAQGYYFGRNKVQYTEFDWHILRTDHFDIYYYPEMQDLAEKGAQFAEESYTLLQTRFNHTITRRVPLIFYGTHMHFQQTNITPGFIPEGVGGFFEFLKGRVVIPANGNINQFRKVIRHELVHVFMHSKVSRVLKNHNRLDGVYPPLWYTEGLAEFWSTDWDSQAEMVIKDAVINNYMVPLDDIDMITGTYMMYKVGQNILEYVAATYGEEKVLLLMENIWKHSRFQDVFQETIGKDYAEFDEEWLYWLKKKYYPQLADHDLSSKTSFTVVRDGYNFKPAYFREAEQEYIVFVANRTGYSSIYMRPLEALKHEESDDAEILVKGEKTSDFEAFHLMSSKIDVNNAGQLVFGTKSGENDALYIYDIPQRKVRDKYYFDNLVGILSPSWSPDGTKVAFAGLSFSGYKDLFIFDTESRELTRLTNDFYDDNDPSWSPDGNFLTFSSDRTDYGKQWSYNIFTININSGEINYVTYGKQKDVAPVYSPDGKYISYTSDRDLSVNICMTEVDKNGRPGKGKYLTRFANATFDPEWTPDGGMLFAVFEDRRFQIRYEPDVLAGADSSFTFPRPEITRASTPWQFKNLAIDNQASRLQYEKDFDLDIAQTQVSNDPVFGTSGGAQVAFTDVLGNDQYHLLVYNNARASSDFLKSFNFALTKVSLAKRTNYAYGIFRFAGRYFNYQDLFFYEERYGGFFALSYPLSHFMRLEFSANYSHSDKEWFGFEERKALLASHFVSFVKDNSIWSPSGPIEGERLNLTIGNTFDIRYSNVNYYTLLLDYRHYFRIGLRSAYAVRLMTLMNEGKEARQYYMGGSWDMRGYYRYSLRGQRLALISQEIRFPFIDLLGIQFPFGSIGFNSIRGALFFDAGNAWDEKWEGMLGSFGVGARMRLIGFLVLRVDFGKKTDFKKVSDGIFTQFFFGWDF